MRYFERKTSLPSPSVNRYPTQDGHRFSSGTRGLGGSEPLRNFAPFLAFDFNQTAIDPAGPGRQVPAAIRKSAEQATGTDLSRVRLHTGQPSAMSALALGARAYTVGNNIHFAPGEFDPVTHHGRRLIAHELIHTIQHQGTPPPTGNPLKISPSSDASEKEANGFTDRLLEGAKTGPVSAVCTAQASAWIFEDLNEWLDSFEEELEKYRASLPEWGPQYKKKKCRVAELPYEEYKSYIGKNTVPDIPDLKAAHAWGGHELLNPDITRAELIAIFPMLANDPDVDSKVRELNRAFSIMMIDTVESQSLFLAHAYVESKQFTTMKEVNGERKYYAPFFGRGPLQVTNEEGYLQSLAYLEVRAGQLDQEGRTEDAKRVRDAVADIKLHPDNALEPEYTYLFSAAFMHQGGGVRGAHRVSPGANFHGGAEATWMIGGNLDKKLKIAQEKQAAGKPEKERKQGAADEREIHAAIGKAALKAAAYTEARKVLGAKPTKN